MRQVKILHVAAMLALCFVFTPASPLRADTDWGTAADESAGIQAKETIRKPKKHSSAQSSSAPKGREAERGKKAARHEFLEHKKRLREKLDLNGDGIIDDQERAASKSLWKNKDHAKAGPAKKVSRPRVTEDMPVSEKS